MQHKICNLTILSVQFNGINYIHVWNHHPYYFQNVFLTPNSKSPEPLSNNCSLLPPQPLVACICFWCLWTCLLQITQMISGITQCCLFMSGFMSLSIMPLPLFHTPVLHHFLWPNNIPPTCLYHFCLFVCLLTGHLESFCLLVIMNNAVIRGNWFLTAKVFNFWTYSACFQLKSNLKCYGWSRWKSTQSSSRRELGQPLCCWDSNSSRAVSNSAAARGGQAARGWEEWNIKKWFHEALCYLWAGQCYAASHQESRTAKSRCHQAWEEH